MRLVVVATHPIQYHAPLFRELAGRVDLHVLFAHRATPDNQAAAGFGVRFDWDIDLTSGFSSSYLNNVSQRPGLDAFGGCDTPEVAADIERLKPDALLVQGWHVKSFWQSIYAARRRKIPVMVRGDSQLQTPRSRLKIAVKEVVYPLALRAFDAALYVGENSRRYWEHYRYPRDRMFFAPHCVDNDWFAERATPEARAGLRQSCGIAEDAFVVLFAGKLAPLKRPLDIVDAVARCRAAGRPVEMILAGSGALEGAVRAHAAQLNAPIHMLGFCNQTQMPAAYAAADVLALASSSETWGLVANEALACGRPAIVSDACGCAPDLVGDGVAGRIFRCGNVGGLASSIADLMERPASPTEIARKIGVYSLKAAADGILSAAERR